MNDMKTAIDWQDEVASDGPTIHCPYTEKTVRRGTPFFKEALPPKEYYVYQNPIVFV